MFDVFYIGNRPRVFGHEKQVQSIEHARSICRTRYFWLINYLADYEGFDFLWEPPPWQAAQIHAWPSQWQKDSATYLVPREPCQDTHYHDGPVITRLSALQHWHCVDDCVQEFDYSWHPDPTDPPYRYQFGTQHQDTGGPCYTVSGAEEVKYVSKLRAVRSRDLNVPRVLINHGNAQHITAFEPDRVTRFVDSYLETLRRVVARADTEWLWIASSVCDYQDFDWSWHPSVWQQHMIHVFASNEQRFGDTFYLHVPTARETLARAELLDWTNLNFVPSISVPRWPMPVNRHSSITQVEAIKHHEFTDVLEIFTMTECFIDPPTISLWRKRSRTVTPLTPGGTTVIVPRDVRGAVNHQLYDYDWLDRSYAVGSDPTLDVIYCSNGESCEEFNYQRLCALVPRHMRVHWIRGVKGRVASQHAGARASTTEFYFFVPSKLAVDENFDWSWHPDMLQSPKHYIFQAHNPITGLTYGHGAMVCNCRSLVLETQGQGLDFTMEKPHEVIDLLSGTLNIGGDPRSIWRTAFREMVKLSVINHEQPDVETEHRIQGWLRGDKGDMGHWSQRGASAGREFFEQHRDDLDALRTTYEWQHLDKIFASTYPNVANIL